MDNKVSKLVAAMRRLADNIESGKEKMGKFGRSYAFRSDGRPCCPFGHAIAMAGARPRKQDCKPKKGRVVLPFEGNVATFWALFPSYDFDVAVEGALSDLEVYNDYLTGIERRDAVVEALRRGADIIENYAA